MKKILCFSIMVLLAGSAWAEEGYSKVVTASGDDMLAVTTSVQETYNPADLEREKDRLTKGRDEIDIEIAKIDALLQECSKLGVK